MQSDGHFVFYRGGRDCFSIFQRLILSSFDDIALQAQKHFSNKQRRTVEGKAKVSRLILSPSKKLTKSDFETLSSHVSKLYTTAIMHSGNPWLLLNLIDRGDGSSFDIHGYPSKVQIIPFNRASSESLMRLIHSMYELFPLMTIEEKSE